MAETFWNNSVFQCPFNDCSFCTKLIQPALEHMNYAHNFSVSNVHQVRPFLDAYLSKMATDDRNDEDLRIELCQETMKSILEQQQREQNDAFDHKCLFCKLRYDDRLEYFEHMFTEHGFSLGQLNNLVNVSEYLHELTKKLDSVTCLYCDKIFVDHITLRKHQRKKKHFRVHSKNSQWDRYYIRNYSWEAMNDDEELESDGDFEEWQEDLQTKTQCLFDDCMFPSIEECLDHMTKFHQVDLLKIQGHSITNCRCLHENQVCELCSTASNQLRLLQM